MRRRNTHQVKEEPSKEAPKVVNKGACPKCGRVIGRGVNFHVKACKG
jgi:hypothetical protein